MLNHHHQARKRTFIGRIKSMFESIDNFIDKLSFKSIIIVFVTVFALNAFISIQYPRSDQHDNDRKLQMQQLAVLQQQQQQQLAVLQQQQFGGPTDARLINLDRMVVLARPPHTLTRGQHFEEVKEEPIPDDPFTLPPAITDPLPPQEDADHGHKDNHSPIRSA